MVLFMLKAIEKGFSTVFDEFFLRISFVLVILYDHTFETIILFQNVNINIDVFSMDVVRFIEEIAVNMCMF